jgi:hypothetical protein
MPAASKPVFLLAVVAATMALLVGLVGSARRAPASVRTLAPLEPWTPAGPAETVLATPRPVGAEDPAPPAAPQGSSSTAPAAPKHVLVRGVVLRPDGEPAAQARLKLGGQVARSSAEGTFQMAFSTGSEGDDLVAFLPGFEPAVRPAFGSSPSGEYDVRLVLGPETLALAGTVVDAVGHPLKGWTVELDGPDPLRDYGLREAVRTDHEGRFVLGDVPAGVHVVRAWRKQRENPTRSGPAAAGEQGLTIVAASDE